MRDRTDRAYERVLGICRWFHVAVNGLIFPVEPGDPILNTAYLAGLVTARTGAERERLDQFIEQLHEILEEHGLAYEGTIELLDPASSPDNWNLVRVAYTARPFWRWY